MKIWRHHGRNGNERAARIAKENRLQSDLEEKNAQLKELSERFEHFKKEEGKQEVAGALKEDKHVCFSAENFKDQDQLRVCPREDQAEVTHATSPISLKLSQMIKVIKLFKNPK